MKRLILLIMILFSGTLYSQSYYLSFEKGEIGCSGGGRYQVYVTENSVAVFDINNNQIIGKDNIYDIRPAKIIQSSTCYFYDEVNDTGFNTYGSNEIIFDINKSCQYMVSSSAAQLRYELKAYLSDLSSIDDNLCIDNQIPLDVESCSGNAEFWEVKRPNENYTVINGTENVNAPLIYYENIYNDDSGLGNPTFLRAKFLDVNIYTEPISITFIGCSPKLQETKTTNETCFGENDGSVTLTFDRNVAEGYEMRYFIYQGAPSEFTTSIDNPFPPQAFDELRIGNLNENGNGTYSGSSNNNLEANDYYVLYQEVKYDLDPSNGIDDPIVKSGEITPQFTIARPTEVLLDQVNSTFTPASCGANATIVMSAIGGNNLDNSGTYSYEYNINNSPWLPTLNPLEITPTAYLQTVGVRAVYSAGNICKGSPVDYVIDPEIPLLTINNTSSITTSISSATDGSIRVEISGGVSDFDYIVAKLNTISGQWETIETQINIPQRIVDFFNKGIGTYRITITDNNGCDITSENIIVTSDTIPDLASEQTDQISCFEGFDGRVSVEVSNFTTNYKYQWIINGIATSIQTGTAGVIKLNNLNEPGDYVLKVSAGRVSDEDFNNPANHVTATFLLNDPDPVVIESIVEKDASCNGSDDGSIALGLSGGTNYEYTFELTPIESDWIPLNGDTINNLPPGFYRVTVRNENGCASNPSVSIFIDEPEQLVLSEISNQRKNVTTNGGNDGEITIEISGGSGTYSYNWSGPNGFASDQQNIVGLIAGDYQVVVTDANNCSENLGPIKITEPGPLGITSLTAINVLCKGDAIGSITAEISGTPPFTFVWTKDGDPSFSAPNQAVIGGLTAGTYSLELTDASGDPAVSSSVVVTEPGAVLFGEVIPTDATCFNGSDGDITINASGGSAPYQYAIDDGFGYQSANNFTNLSARTFTITVQDDNGCLFQTTVDIEEPDAITVDTVNTKIINATTTGGSDGAIDLAVIGGTATYSYEWSGPNVNGHVEQNITGLIAGTYQVTVTDGNGCTLDAEFNIEEPEPLAITNIQEFNVNCNGESSGRITTTVTGNGTITFEWRNVATNTIISAAGKDLIDIAAGIYTLTIADETANPPVTSRQITIIEPEILSAVVIPSEVSCFGGNDGILQVNVGGGTPPFTYALDGINFQNNNQFNGLVAGTYDVTIRDNNNCDLITNAVLAEPQELGIIIDQEKNLTAANTADGAISITVFGGTAPYSYQWVSDNGFTSTEDDVSNLEGGRYTLVIRDANNTVDGDGCYFTRNFTIVEPGELLATLTQTVFLECNGDDFAELTANVQGGVAPYTYEWYKVQNGSNSLLLEDLEIIGDLIAGVYLVSVTDINAVSVETSPITVVEPDLLEINIDGKVDVLCTDEATGSIAISIDGGTTPYQYFWDNGEITEDLVGLLAGEYVIEVVDANGCFAERGITINTPADVLRIANATVTNVSEYQANDGSIVLDIVGGSGSYDISWTRLLDNTFVGDTASLDNLTADRYEVIFTDANGCSVTESYEISQPDIVEATVVSPTCAGASDGNISIVVNKGNGAFTYSWNTGDTISEINGLAAGSYTVTINGLDEGPITRAFELIDPFPLSVDLGEDKMLCDGQQLELDATVSDPTASYLWSSDNGFSSTEPIVILTEKGEYSLVVESENGCRAQGAVFLDVSSDEISAEFAVSSQVFVSEPLILVDISYPLPEIIEWIVPEEATIVKMDNDEAELVFNSPGEYEIGIITHRGQCSAHQTKRVLVLAKDATVSEEDTESNKKIIEDFVVFPNPTEGQFNAKINLSERGNISIRVFSFANNAMIASEKARGESTYAISMDISGKPSGVYAIVLETPYGTSLRKIILK